MQSKFWKKILTPKLTDWQYFLIFGKKLQDLGAKVIQQKSLVFSTLTFYLSQYLVFIIYSLITKFYKFVKADNTDDRYR